MTACTAVLICMGLPMLSLIVLDRAVPWTDVALASKLFEYFLYGAILSTWIPAVMRTESGDV